MKNEAAILIPSLIQLSLALMGGYAVHMINVANLGMGESDLIYWGRVAEYLSYPSLAGLLLIPMWTLYWMNKKWRELKLRVPLMILGLSITILSIAGHASVILFLERNWISPV